jgi:hypothetical protein
MKSPMSISRRKFVKAGSMAALIGLSVSPFSTALGQTAVKRAQNEPPDNGYFLTPAEATTDRVFYFQLSTFEPHLNTDFTSRLGVAVTTLRLTEVEACPTPAATENAGECFTLTFRADRELNSLSTIHTLEHGALGEFQIFVSPTKHAKDPDGLYYVAVINHRIETGPRKRTAPRAAPRLAPKGRGKQE